VSIKPKTNRLLVRLSSCVAIDFQVHLIGIVARSFRALSLRCPQISLTAAHIEEENAVRRKRWQSFEAQSARGSRGL
jgi:hypothetical protein